MTFLAGYNTGLVTRILLFYFHFPDMLETLRLHAFSILAGPAAAGSLPQSCEMQCVRGHFVQRNGMWAPKHQPQDIWNLCELDQRWQLLLIYFI